MYSSARVEEERFIGFLMNLKMKSEYYDVDTIMHENHL